MATLAECNEALPLPSPSSSSLSPSSYGCATARCSLTAILLSISVVSMMLVAWDISWFQGNVLWNCLHRVNIFTISYCLGLVQQSMSMDMSPQPLSWPNYTTNGTANQSKSVMPHKQCFLTDGRWKWMNSSKLANNPLGIDLTYDDAYWNEQYFDKESPLLKAYKCDIDGQPHRWSNFVWTPSKRKCQRLFERFSRENWCKVLDNRSVLFIGDSLTENM